MDQLRKPDANRLQSHHVPAEMQNRSGNKIRSLFSLKAAIRKRCSGLFCWKVTQGRIQKKGSRVSRTSRCLGRTMSTPGRTSAMLLTAKHSDPGTHTKATPGTRKTRLRSFQTTGRERTSVHAHNTTSTPNNPGLTALFCYISPVFNTALVHPGGCFPRQPFLRQRENALQTRTANQSSTRIALCRKSFPLSRLENAF